MKTLNCLYEENTPYPTSTLARRRGESSRWTLREKQEVEKWTESPG